MPIFCHLVRNSFSSFHFQPYPKKKKFKDMHPNVRSAITNEKVLMAKAPIDASPPLSGFGTSNV